MLRRVRSLSAAATVLRSLRAGPTADTGSCSSTPSPSRLHSHRELCYVILCLRTPGASGASFCSVGGSRGFSIQPENTVYGGPSTPAPQRVTLRTLGEKYRQGQLISMVTAYDYPSAVHVRYCLSGAHASSAINSFFTSFPLGDLRLGLETFMYHPVAVTTAVRYQRISRACVCAHIWQGILS